MWFELLQGRYQRASVGIPAIGEKGDSARVVAGGYRGLTHRCAMPALRTAVEMALTAVHSELSSWVISPVPRAFLPSSMTKRVRVTILVSKAAWSVMLGPGCGSLGDRCGRRDAVGRGRCTESQRGGSGAGRVPVPGAG